MKVSISWLKQLVNLNCSVSELVNLLPLRSVSTKEVTDQFIELDMKGYNRADLLSMRGVAQEVAAITGSKLSFEKPQEAEFVWSQTKLPTTPVKIEEDILAEVQCVAKIEGLSFGNSPLEWVKKLENSGMRSVNNIVDVTNLIMLEYGQPLHSFDASTIKDDTINVRRAKEGEQITTLDNKLRKLTSEDIVLADTEKAIDIAGIMGGKDTETKESTQTILLTASLFSAQMIRKTSMRVKLASEASKRFYHGLTKKRLLQSFNAAIKLYQQLGGKLTAVTLVGDLEDKKTFVKLTRAKLDELVGVKISDGQVEDYLKSLGFHPRGGGTDSWEVEVPYFRLDVNLEEDVIEEVARMYGYEKIPAKKVSESKPLQKEDPLFEKISDLREKLVEIGLTEVQTYSFITTEMQDALGINDSNRGILVKLQNPMSAETEYLRQSIWPNLVEAVGKNIKKGYKDIGIFEIGKAFSNMDGKPTENYRLAIALMNSTDNPLAELYKIAGDLRLHLEGAKLNKALFHPKRITNNVAEVHLRVLSKLGIAKRVAILEVRLDMVA